MILSTCIEGDSNFCAINKTSMLTNNEEWHLFLRLCSFLYQIDGQWQPYSDIAGVLFLLTWLEED